VTIDDHEEPQPEHAGPKADQRVWTERDLVLRRVAIARGAVVLVGMIVILAWPERNSDTTAAILGAVAIAVAVTTYFTGRSLDATRIDSRRVLIARTALLAIVGLVLILWPNATARVLGILVGVVLLVLGMAGVVRGLWRDDGVRSSTMVWRGASMTLAGVIALMVPEGTANILLLGLAVAWAVDAVAALLAVPPEGGAPVVPVLSEGLQGLLGRFPMDDDQRRAVTEKLFFEGAAARNRLWRFGLLTALSTAIATLGIVVDSTAVVIGAMLIAPLMTPIMGAAAGLVSAWPVRVLRALLTVGAGVLLAVFVAWVITGVLAQASDPILTSSQVTSRVNPTFIDLLIALAAGAAGAFAVSRADIADSLPGAAIAVALVPPLSVIGITLRIGDFDDVIGASLLFLINLIGMILSGSLVFVLTGYPPVERLRARSAEVTRSLFVVSALMMLVAVPLVVTGRQLTEDLTAENNVESAVQSWVDETDLSIVELDVDGSTVSLVVAGDTEPENVDDLGAELEDVLGSDVELQVTIVPTIQLTYSSDE
jgi:uncharacterized hydrophobic protein (TIGR00271 family)